MSRRAFLWRVLDDVKRKRFDEHWERQEQAAQTTQPTPPVEPVEPRRNGEHSALCDITIFGKRHDCSCSNRGDRHRKQQ